MTISDMMEMLLERFEVEVIKGEIAYSVSLSRNSVYVGTMHGPSLAAALRNTIAFLLG